MCAHTNSFESLVIGLEVAVLMGFQFLKVRGDSKLVIRQLTGESRVPSWKVALCQRNYQSQRWTKIGPLSDFRRHGKLDE